MSNFAQPGRMKYLKSTARKAACFRNHALGNFRALHSWAAVADCQNNNCHASVYVTTKPQPNGIDISGLAVAVNCGSPDCTHTAKHLAPPYGEDR